MFVLLCLAYFTSVMSSRFIHASACVRISFLFQFKLNNIPLCDYTTLCLSIHQLMDIWVVSIFWLLWKMQLWIWCANVSSRAAFSSFECAPRSGIPGLYGNSMFDFILLFFMVVVSFYVLTNNAPGLQLLHILINTCFSYAFLCRMEKTLLYRFLEMELLGQMYMPSKRLYQFILPPSVYGSSYLPFPHPP